MGHSAEKCQCKRQFHWGLIAFILSFFVAIGCLVALGQGSKEHGTPHSSECLEAFRSANLTAYMILFLAPIGFSLLYFQIAGKLMSMAYWFMLAFVFGICLIAWVKALIWLCMEEETRINDMLKLSENTYQNFKEYTRHSSEIEIKHKCCGIVNFTDYPERIYAQPDANRARVPDRCCATNFKSCGRSILYKDAWKYGRQRTTEEASGLPVGFKPEHCNTKLTPEITKAKLDEILKEFVEKQKQKSIKLKDGDKVKDFMCKESKVDGNDIFCAKHPTGGHEEPRPRWLWCYFLFYSVNNPSDVLDLEVIRMRVIQTIRPNGCFKHLEPYVDQLATTIFGFATALLILISTMLPFYLHIYWNYREKELQVYPLPYWFDKLPNEKEKDLPVGLGNVFNEKDPFTQLNDQELEVAIRAEVEEESKHPEHEVHLDPWHEATHQKRPHHHAHDHQKTPHQKTRRSSVDEGTETGSTMVSDSLTVPSVRPKVKKPTLEPVKE